MARAGWASLGVVAAAIALAWLMVKALPVDAALERWHDWQAVAWAPAAPADAAVVVDVDEASLKKLGAWPLRRDAYLPAARWMLEQGVRAIAFDFVFVDPMPGDDAFAAWALAEGRPVVLGARASRTQGTHAWARAVPAGCQAQQIEGWQLPRWLATDVPGGAPHAPRPAQVGSLSLPVDADGVLRRLPLWQQSGGVALPVLPLAAWLVAHPAAAMVCSAKPRALMQAGARAWALDEAHQLRPWLASAAHSPVLTLGQVDAAAKGELPPAQTQALAQKLRGRTVFLGASVASGDQVVTVHGLQSGPQAAAAIHDALAHGQVLTPPQPAGDLALLGWLALPAAAVAWGLWRRRTLSMPLLWAATGLAVLGLLMTDAARLAGAGQLSSMGWPLLALLWAAVGLTWLAWRLRAQQASRLVHRETQLLDAHQVKSDFLAHVGHEVRTPLNAMLGAAEMLAGTRLDATQRRYTQLFISAGEELMQMLDDLLDLSKSEAGLLTLHPQSLSLGRLVAEQYALFEPRAAHKGLKLQVKADDDLPDAVYGDPIRLAQVLRNLIGNAIKFTNQGQVLLRVSRGSTADRLRFEVHDTGVGIPAERLRDVFAPYVQAGEGVALRMGGTGLGLAIVKRLVDAMRGEVSAQSQVGSGSVFVVELPLAPARPTAARWEGAVQASGGAGQGADGLPAGQRQAGVPTEIPPELLAGRLTSRQADADEALRHAPSVAQVLRRSVADLGLKSEASLGPLRSRASLFDAEPVPLAARVAPAPAAGRAGQSVVAVLAADDNPHNLGLLQAFLEGTGYRLEGVHDGQGALANFERGSYRIVLLDLNMPGLNGLEVASRIRALERSADRPACRLVAVTGQRDEKDVRTARAAGFDALLGKPFSRAQLLAVMAPAGGLAASAPPAAGLAASVLAAARAQAGEGASTPGQTSEPADPVDATDVASAFATLPDTDIPAALDRLGSPRMYDRVMEAAREPLLHFESRLSACLDALPCDLEAARRLAHDLKSTAATLGLPGLSRDAAWLEAALAETVAPTEDESVRAARKMLAMRMAGVRDVLHALP